MDLLRSPLLALNEISLAIAVEHNVHAAVRLRPTSLPHLISAAREGIRDNSLKLPPGHSTPQLRRIFSGDREQPPAPAGADKTREASGDEHQRQDVSQDSRDGAE
jgi:hypothetical protein